jgi:hypothetical protein
MRTNLAASRFYTLGVMPTRLARRRRIGWRSAVEVRGGKGQRPPGVLRGAIRTAPRPRPACFIERAATPERGAQWQILHGVTEPKGPPLIWNRVRDRHLLDTSKPSPRSNFMRKSAFALAAIAAAVLSVSEIPSAQAYVHHRHHLSYHRHHHQPYVARNGSQNGGNWSSDRLNGRGINGLGTTTNSGRKYNGG